MTGTIPTATETPFLGLRYFDEEHSHLFFGREEQVDDLLAKLGQSRFVAVLGSSGSGKSSLVRAGLVPALRSGMLSSAGPRWRVVKFRPEDRPVARLAESMEEEFGASALRLTLERGPLGLVEAAQQVGLQEGENLLIVADQFEEIFRAQKEATNPQEADAQAKALVKLLLYATGQRDLAIHVVLTMRSDFLGDCAQFRDLPERVNEGIYLVPRMRRDQLQQAIRGPIAVFDGRIGNPLVQHLLNVVGDDPDQLPLLQHLLARTWNHWRGQRTGRGEIDLEDLEAVGGWEDCLSRHANKVYAPLLPPEQSAAELVFRRLTERDEANRDVRSRATLHELSETAGPGADGVVETFRREGFLLPAPPEDLKPESLIDIIHESLIRHWDRLQGDSQKRGWLKAEVEARDLFCEMERRSQRGRPEDDPLGGTALRQALGLEKTTFRWEWARRYVKDRGSYDRTMGYLEASALIADRAARRAKRRRWLAVGAALGIAC